MNEDMKNTTANNDSIYLKFDGTGPHIEHMKEFEGSYFKSVYKRAFLQLDDIIATFKQSSKNGLTVNRGYYDNTTPNMGSNYENSSNIITFAGRRGSGKSSAMLSFTEALKHYYSYEKMSGGNLPFKLTSVKQPVFSCLDCIDGSLLEHGEDIFKIVLAQMYQKFVDLDKNNGIFKEEGFVHKKKELLRQLEGIYRTVCDIESMENKQVLAGESYMSSLQSLSSSQKVKKDFEELIKEFTALMKYERPGILEVSNDHFVIIPIDDIDLNVSNGFSMLEKIHRYCMVQNVIVLLSVDIQQMLSIVSKSFYKGIPKVDKLLRDGQDQIHELSVDYINKVMPVNYRLYIPDINNHYSLYAVSIEREKSSVKRAVFWKLYRRIGIYFDSRGIKQHFYEPRSMRQLACFYLMLDFMEKEHIKKHDIYSAKELSEMEIKRFVTLWEENYELLTADLWNRIVIEKLYTDKDAFKLCEEIEKEDVRRAKDRVVNFYNKLKYEEEKKPSCCKCCCAVRITVEIKGETRDGDAENCSYGELVEAIYGLGRIEEGKYKPLVHYLLGYFSYAFTRIYIYEKFGVKHNGMRLVEEGTFKTLLGKNIVDKWSKDLLPYYPKEINKGINENGTIRNDSSIWEIKTRKNHDRVVLQSVLSFTLDSSRKFTGENGRKKKIRYVAELIRNIEVAALFFSNIREDKRNEVIKLECLEWKFEIIIYLDGTRKISLKPQVKNSGNLTLAGQYSVLNIVENSIDAVKTLKKIEGNLIECLAEEYKLYSSEDKTDTKREVSEDFKRELQKISLKTQYEEWERKFGKHSLPLPLFWFDFSYNVLKRVRREMKERFFVSRKEEDLFFFIQDLYESIKKQLKEQQEFYSFGEERQPDYSYQLVKRFEECPVIKYFLKDGENELMDEENRLKDVESKKRFINNLMSRMADYAKVND